MHRVFAVGNGALGSLELKRVSTSTARGLMKTTYHLRLLSMFAPACWRDLVLVHPMTRLARPTDGTIVVLLLWQKLGLQTDVVVLHANGQTRLNEKSE